MPRDASPGPAPVCRIAVKVVPNAARDEVAGEAGGEWRVRLRSPPVDGRANAALVEFLANRLGVPRRALVLERGDTARHKLVRIEGLEAAVVRARLAG